MEDFYGSDLAAIHAEAFETLAAAAAETVLAHVASPSPSRLLLDLGCGAGPLSLQLSQHGFRVWGVDLSPALIELARARLPVGEFVNGSVVDVPLPTASAVVAVGEVLNYATASDPDQLAQVFERVFDALEPGGLFLFDLAGAGRGKVSQAFTEGADWAVGMIATEHNDLLTRQITSFRRTTDGAWRRGFEKHRLRLWAASDVTSKLAAAGFNTALLDGYAGLQTPPSLQVYLARKPSAAHGE